MYGLAAHDPGAGQAVVQAAVGIHHGAGRCSDPQEKQDKGKDDGDTFGPVEQRGRYGQRDQQREPNDGPAGQQVRPSGRFAFGVDHRQSEDGVSGGPAERECQELEQRDDAQ